MKNVLNKLGNVTLWNKRVIAIYHIWLHWSLEIKGHFKVCFPWFISYDTYQKVWRMDGKSKYDVSHHLHWGHKEQKLQIITVDLYDWYASGLCRGRQSYEGIIGFIHLEPQIKFLQISKHLLKCTERKVRPRYTFARQSDKIRSYYS